MEEGRREKRGNDSDDDGMSLGIRGNGMDCMERRDLYLLECISPEFGMPDAVSPIESVRRDVLQRRR